MSDIPIDLHYTESHEWVRLDDDGSLTVGITDHAQSQLGDMVFVELPEIDQGLEAGDACAVVESVKAASDIYAPLAGTVTEANEDLEDSPELVNQDPHGAGWLIKIQPVDAEAIDGLMDADAYLAFVEAEEH
ncbi:MAG: glycine cleavage system protein GcvH [Gammaproteobacteria bacterium]